MVRKENIITWPIAFKTVIDDYILQLKVCPYNYVGWLSSFVGISNENTQILQFSVFNKFLLLNTCPTHVFCLSLIFATRLLSSSACCSTARDSVSCPSIWCSECFSTTTFLAPLVSVFQLSSVTMYLRHTLHISTFRPIYFFFSVRCSFPPSNVFLSFNAVLAIAILVFISCSHRSFFVMIFPRYRNCFTCSI